MMNFHGKMSYYEQNVMNNIVHKMVQNNADYLKTMMNYIFNRVRDCNIYRKRKSRFLFLMVEFQVLCEH